MDRPGTEEIRKHCACHGIAPEVTKELVEQFNKTGYARSPLGGAEWGDVLHETNVLPAGHDKGGPGKPSSKNS